MKKTETIKELQQQASWIHTKSIELKNGQDQYRYELLAELAKEYQDIIKQLNLIFSKRRAK